MRSGAGSRRPGPAFLFRRAAVGRSRLGDRPAWPVERVGPLAPARRRAAASASGRGLQLAGLARLGVVALAAQVRENAGLLHLLLEALERPVEAIIIAELDLDQSASLLVLGCPREVLVKTLVTRVP